MADTVPSSSPLLLLPRELRDRIYHLSLLDQEFKIQDKKLQCMIQYGKYVHGRNKPLWIFACRQLCDEALFVFYKRARLRHYHRARSRSIDSNQYFNLSRLESLELDLLLISQGEDVVGSEKKRAKIVPGPRYIDFDPGSGYIVEAYKGVTSSLRHLKLAIDMGRDIYEEDPYYIRLPDPDTIGDWDIDLSYLEGLGNCFESFECVLNQREMVGRSSGAQHQAWLIVVPLVQNELIRLAKALVGGESFFVKDERLLGPYWRLSVRRALKGESAEDLGFLGLPQWPSR